MEILGFVLIYPLWPHFPPLSTMEDLAGQCARLSLQTKECQTISLTSEVEDNNKTLVAKLFTKRRINIEALSRTLKNMWRFVQDFEVQDLTANTVLLPFMDEANTQRSYHRGHGLSTNI